MDTRSLVEVAMQGVERVERGNLWEKYLPPMWPPIWPPLWPPVWRAIPVEKVSESAFQSQRQLLANAESAFRGRDADQVVLSDGRADPKPSVSSMEYAESGRLVFSQEPWVQGQVELQRYSSALRWHEWIDQSKALDGCPACRDYRNQ
ncbi:MAG: hypothetical protein NZM42_02080 [Gemmatales bacterium]|nr:hypothetical protein [Gemmatales bacterium]MDW8221850.1 hypothetical protein [Gemmatales bacterium]